MQIFNLAEELEKERKKNKELQEENEKLKRNQANALNRIKDLINLSKCEAVEGNYSTDNHSRYWNLFRKFAEELKGKIKGVDTSDYVYIPKWREGELLNLEDRIDKAIEYIKENCYDEERKMIINELYNEIPELLNILKGSDNNE